MIDAATGQISRGDGREASTTRRRTESYREIGVRGNDQVISPSSTVARCNYTVERSLNSVIDVIIKVTDVEAGQAGNANGDADDSSASRRPLPLT